MSLGGHIDFSQICRARLTKLTPLHCRGVLKPDGTATALRHPYEGRMAHGGTHKMERR
eukprot:CAMPEP_0171309584 /NCGR_PEP_ID=MMETSP0816-20121228/19767_1 /TAXON_ID=420281 /ORGANISM="Proboscia inermis, Strain CCAP1064/1" /LENGTH=57 /DNA_ID=CAMNT_0011793235 /DNA_START=47 /DNA_END=216 /DNA_ORIENTATION=+